MGVEKETRMVIKVNLQCPCCYKKIKRTLCGFPQIRDQVYNEKTNTVEIVVVCCSPEKIMDKLRSKGGKVIESIEIKKPPAVVVVTEKPKGGDKPKEGDKPKADGAPPADKPKVVVVTEKPKGGDKPKADGAPPAEKAKGDKPKADGAPPAEKAAEKTKEAAPKVAEPAKSVEPMPANGVPSVFPYYDPFAAGPYYHGYGFPPPPPQPCYEGYYGYGYAQHGHGHAHGYGNVYGHGYGRGGHVIRGDGYFCEENPQTCSIM